MQLHLRQSRAEMLEVSTGNFSGATKIIWYLPADLSQTPGRRILLLVQWAMAGIVDFFATTLGAWGHLYRCGQPRQCLAASAVLVIRECPRVSTESLHEQCF
jgi:hypothetical protein